MAMNVRGDSLAYEQYIFEKAQKKLKLMGSSIVDWIPCQMHLSITDKANLSGKPSAMGLINSSQNVQWIKNAAEKFTSQFRRKAYLHSYTSLGMDEMEFTEAESNCNDLLSEYIPWGGDYIDDD